MQTRGCKLACLLVWPLIATADEFPTMGQVQPRSARDIAASDWSVGGETLDRDFTSYDAYKSYLGPLGAKHLRLQAGWAKCEKTPGVYEFAWLDSVVDDALAQGVQPWLETAYGNTLYPGGGGTGLGGGLPASPEGLAAWDRWVAALVTHFKDRVTAWEIWNEPDLGKGNQPDAYAGLFIRTAETIRGIQPAARIYALGLAHNLSFAEQFLVVVKERQKLGLIDAITIHGYPKNPDETQVDQARAMIAKFSPTIELRQGESGAPSKFQPNYALSNLPWSENTQAKWNLRRMLAHRAKDVPFNLFSMSDLHYVRNGQPDMNYKGLLGTNPDKTISHVKPAYGAAQRVFTLFDSTITRVTNFTARASVTNVLSITAYRQKSTDAGLVACWFRGAPVKESNETTPVDFTFRGIAFKEPVLIDLLDGRVREIPASHRLADDTSCSFRGIPVYDAPVLIAERSLVPLRIVARKGSS